MKAMRCATPATAVRGAHASVRAAKPEVTVLTAGSMLAPFLSTVSPAAAAPTTTTTAMAQISMPEMPELPLPNVDLPGLVDQQTIDKVVAQVVPLADQLLAYVATEPEKSAAAAVGLLAILIYTFRPREIEFKEEGGSMKVSYKNKDGSKGKAEVKELARGEKLFFFKK